MTTAFSPGRINIIGEHIDYNDGYVLPAAINLVTKVGLSLNGTETNCTFSSTNLNDSFNISLNDLNASIPKWGNYLVGVLKILGTNANKLKGFTCQISSTIPLGSGLSSSASLLCSFLGALNKEFNLELSKKDIINLAVATERQHVGVNCGIMDHFASVMGKKNNAIFLDCNTQEYQYLPTEFKNHEFLIINSNVSHSLDSSEYNTRREECNTALAKVSAKFSDINTFRDVASSHLDDCQGILTTKEYKRVSHVISEIARVIEAKNALLANDFITLGNLLYQSHDSLNTDYEVSCKELNFMVNQAKKDPNILGSRMMGGGFGGCTISLVKKGHSAAFIKSLSTGYKNEFGIDCTPIEIEIGDGLRVE